MVNLPWFIKILNLQTYSNTEMRPRSATPPSGWSGIRLVAVACTRHLFVEKQKTNSHLNEVHDGMAMKNLTHVSHSKYPSSQAAHEIR